MLILRHYIVNTELLINHPSTEWWNQFILSIVLGVEWGTAQNVRFRQKCVDNSLDDAKSMHYIVREIILLLKLQTKNILKF